MTVDYDAILSRIVDILQADKTLANLIDKFRYAEFDTVGDRIEPSECHIYTPEDMMTTPEQYGRSSDTDEQFRVYVDIKVNGFAETPADAKRDMLEKVTLVQDILMKNRTMRKPSDGSDALAVRSLILAINEVAEFKGSLVPISIIHMRIQVGSEITMTIDTVGEDLAVLFAPTGQDLVEYGTIPSTFGKLDGYAAISNTRIRYYDLENTRDILDPLNTIRDAQEKISYILKESGKETEYEGYISTVSPGQAYDGTPMVTLKLYIL